MSKHINKRTEFLTLSGYIQPEWPKVTRWQQTSGKIDSAHALFYALSRGSLHLWWPWRVGSWYSQ